MDINLRIQAAAICFYLITVSQYIRANFLKTRSNRVFTALLTVGGINLFFDVLTVCTISFSDRIPAWFNRVAHQFFIGSLDLFIALLFLYVLTIVYNQVHFTKKIVICVFLPFIVSLPFLIFGKLSYYHVANKNYSYGNMADTIYVCMGLYLLLSIVFLLLFQHNIKKTTRNAILVAIGIQIGISLIQLNFPTLLISGLGVVILITFIFYTLANPKEYVDSETSMLNHYGFSITLNDLCNRSTSYYVFTLVFDNWTIYHSRFGEDFTKYICQGINERILEVTTTKVFRTRTNCFNFIFNGNETDCELLESKLAIAFTHPIHMRNTTIRPMPRILFLECPRYASMPEEVFKITEMFMRKELFPDNQTTTYQYDDDMDKTIKRYISIENLVRRAVDNDGFFIAYQPIYSTKEHCFTSCEALVRLKDLTTLGFISPEEFIGVAERFGMIHQLGSIVFELICQFIERENPAQYGLHYIEVNLSAIQCMNPDLANELIQTMRKYNIPADFINFEITESAAALDVRTMKDNINRLTDYGCSFSMDDYGTGYSNLAAMTDMPYDLIKLDKSLIWPYFEGRKKNQIILVSSINMIKSMGAKIVAEGVETKEQLQTLTEFGVDYIQGYYFSKPISDQKFIKFLQKDE